MLLSFALSAVALAACGQSAAAPAATVLADACQDYALAYCPQHHACQALADATMFGDVATCVERVALDCAQKAAIPGTNYGVGLLETCAKELLGNDCETIFAAQGYKLEACTQLVHGTVADQGPCAVDLQCQSGLCSFGDPASECGTCASTVLPLMPCDDLESTCAPGAYCDSGQRVCLALGTQGDACDSNLDSCAAGLGCPAGLCTLAQEPGAPCGFSMNPFCDDARGIVCDGSTLTCVLPTIMVQQAGEGCPDEGESLIAVCAPGSYCHKPVTGLALCTPRARDGEFCESSQSDVCLFPSTCVAGTCSPPDLPVCN